MTRKELRRVDVVVRVDSRRLTGEAGAWLLGVSVRQVRRLVRRYRERGAAGLAHGNRGRPSCRRLDEGMRERIVGLVKDSYKDYNTCHLQETLADDHEIVVSYGSLRALRNAAGLPSPRTRRAPRYRGLRERLPQAGMLLQADGSEHDWLEGRGPQLCLVAYIDDATNEVPGAVFREEEDAAGYMLALSSINQSHGLPLAIYADRHTIFLSPKRATLEQELAGQQPRSQFGRCLNELGITYIAAYSPQAKGRIERLFGTLQDRLVKALRRAGATTCAEANAALAAFLPRFNARFAKQAPQPGSAYRPWPADSCPSDVFCFKHTRTVTADNTISFDGHRLPIPPGPDRCSYARARVEVRQHLDGQLSVHAHGRQLACFQPVVEGPPQVGHFTPRPQPLPEHPTQQLIIARAAGPKPTQKPPYKPAPDHPWRRPFTKSRPKTTP